MNSRFLGNPLRLGVSALSLVVLAGCGPSRVKITQETNAVGLPRPAAVYVYDFAVSPSEVQLDQGGPLRRIGSRLLGEGGDPDQQAIDTGHQVADRLATDLVAKITAMGLPAQRITRSQVPPEGAVAVGGQFVSVDEGSQLKRMAIGFHQGQSSVTAQVQLYQVTGRREAAQLLEFTASSASPPTPGAVVTMGAGAAVQAGAAASGVKELTSTVEADAGRLADAVARNLQTFFAKQGWTAPPSQLPSLPDLP
ncbi:MAG: DUF4410 domain-containing protein [Deltaproteobacteria bacterium]|nr:DUF4410 domain-containing protein [Deltaproteobacteria bacterium]